MKRRVVLAGVLCFLVIGCVSAGKFGKRRMSVFDPVYKTSLFVTQEVEAAEVEGRVTVGDARPLLLARYLEKYHSPLLPYAQKIFQMSVELGYDYRWIVAIAQQESNLCKKIPEDSFNCWGYGIHSRGTLRFESYDLALASYSRYLKREYFDKGLTTAEQIMVKYAPYSPGSWAFGVNQFMADIEEGE